MKINALAIAAVFSLSVVASADDLYGLSSSTPGTIFKLDTATGNATAVVNLSGAAVSTSIVDIEFLGGTAFLCDVSNGSVFTFGSVDINTGVYTQINTQGGSSNWWGLAAKESAGYLYTVDWNDNNNLKTVTAAGVITTIGQTGIGARGLTYDTLTDTLYAMESGNLYTLDQSTGANTLIGSFGISENDGDLAYDVSTNTLFLNDGASLYTVNKLTGSASLVGSNNQPNFFIDGLGSYSQPVPEPATMAALGLGIAAFLKRRKK